MKIPYMRSEHLSHVRSSLCMHSIIHSGLIAVGTDTKEGRQTVFFTEQFARGRIPRRVGTRKRCSRMQKYWINLGKAQDKGLDFWQARSNVIILHDSVSADCIKKVVNTKNKEILYLKVSLPPRPPIKFILKDTCQDQREDSHQRLQNPRYSTSGSRARRRANTRNLKVSASSRKSPRQGCIHRRSAVQNVGQKASSTALVRLV